VASGLMYIVLMELRVVLATGLGNTPAVWVLPSGLVWVGSRPGEKPDPHSSWRDVTWPGNQTVGNWLGWNRTAVPNSQFQQLWLSLSI
jgi:hypothetical protein